MFNATHVPVGSDQVQHIEIARDLAEKFNRTFGEVLTLPKAVVSDAVKTLPGIDGRKMSKSYDNHIPLFEESKKMRKRVMKIVTDSTPPEAPKDPNDSLLFDLYKVFANKAQIEALHTKYREGIGWGYVKEDLYQVLEETIAPMREKYESYMKNKNEIDRILKEGAEKARPRAFENLQKIRKAIGIKS